MRERILEERKQVDYILEGKCTSYGVETEKKVNKRIVQLVNDQDMIKTDVNNAVKKCREEVGLVERGLQEERLKIDSKI
jgi:hypothetical protein